MAITTNLMLFGIVSGLPCWRVISDTKMPCNLQILMSQIQETHHRKKQWIYTIIR